MPAYRSPLGLVAVAIPVCALLCLSSCAGEEDSEPAAGSEPSDASGPVEDTSSDPAPDADSPADTSEAEDAVGVDIMGSDADPIGEDVDAEDIPEEPDVSGSTDTPDEGGVEPGLVTEPVSLVTTDGKTLAALFHRDATSPVQAPGLLLVHQFKATKEQWDPVIEDLTGLGWRVLAIDLRGHGASDPANGNLVDILHDAAQAPLDVQAGLAWLTASGEADPARLAIVGTSIGANLACVSSTLGYGTKLHVALSPRDVPVVNLAGNPAEISFSGLYCVAGALDNGGVQAQTCESFVSDAEAPKEVVVLPDTAAHGKAIVSDFPEEWAKIVSWLQSNL